MLLILIFVGILSFIGLAISQDTLVTLQVIFRHGASVPQNLSSLTNDTCSIKPAKNYTNITEEGIRQVQSMGYVMRAEYDDFICNDNLTCDDTNNFTIFSSNVISCVESAQVLINTVFGPITSRKATPMTPDMEGALASDDLKNNWPSFCTQNSTYQSLMQKISKDYNVTSIQELVDLANYTLYQEASSCSRLPWLRNVSADLAKVYDEYSASFLNCESSQIVNNFTDTLITTILNQFNYTQFNKNTAIYAMQADNLAILMSRLRVFDGQPVPFGAALYMELHNTSNAMVVRLFYDNTADHVRTPLQVKGCEMDCPLVKFSQLTGDLDKCPGGGSGSGSGGSSLQSVLLLVFFAFSFFQAKLSFFSSA